MNENLLDKGIPSSKSKEHLNTANMVLIMGVLSLLMCPLFFFGMLPGLIPVFLGVAAIVKGMQGISLFRDYPNDYTRSSLGKVRAGLICGIIGICIYGLLWILIFAILAN